MRVLSLVLFGLCICGPAALAARQAPGTGGSEAFGATARAENATGAAVSAPILVHLDRYTPDFDRTRVEEALKVNGYLGFVPALRKAPQVGYVELQGRRVTIRWARQVPSDAGRTIVVVTEKPVAFLGGGQEGAKPRAGYEVAVIELKVDAHGNGTGRMAAAARVKAGGETGVLIDDYAADTPVALSAVTRK